LISTASGKAHGSVKTSADAFFKARAAAAARAGHLLTAHAKIGIGFGVQADAVQRLQYRLAQARRSDAQPLKAACSLTR
jgi:hypothetical protein